jgi:hypothetical protein
VLDAPRQEKKLPGSKHLAVALKSDLYRSLDALNRDLSRNPVRWKCLSGNQDKADNFQFIGLEQRDGSRALHVVANRMDINGLT